MIERRRIAAFGGFSASPKATMQRRLELWKPLDERQENAFAAAWQQLPADLRKSVN